MNQPGVRTIGGAVAFALLMLALPAGAESFRDWLRKDRKQQQEFLEGKPDGGEGQPAAGRDTKEPFGPVTGRYDVRGRDPGWGEYTGQAEIRPADGGNGWVVLHTATWADADFEGDRIALAWEGTAAAAGPPVVVRLTLDRAGFITHYKSWRRGPGVIAPVVLEAQFEAAGPGELQGVFREEGGTTPVFTESWTRTGPGAPEPIWRNQRVLRPAHDPPDAEMHALLFATFSSFHALPAVAPYTQRPEFRAGVHYVVFDPTDYEFCRQNPGVLRVIQKTVEPLNLVEARMRNRAYRQTLAEKAAYFDREMPARHLNEAGMIGYVDPSLPDGRQHLPDGDGMAWTGDYVAGQAIRHMVTGDAEAMRNMLRALNGLFLCYDIAPEKGDFARTVRRHEEGTEGRGEKQWIRGEPPHQDYDWLSGGNNDMLKGYRHGFLWAWLALQKAGEGEAERGRMVEIVRELLEHSPLAGDKKLNEAYFRLLLHLMTRDPVQYARYLAMYVYLEPWLVDAGHGSRYEYGVADWSGNYMNIKCLVELLTVERELERAGLPVKHIGDYRDALARALRNMRHTRLGYYQLAGAALGRFESPPPELEDALWILREFPAPKVFYDLDWRINPAFCLSPVPNLPWKRDWDKGVNRTVSLVMVPLFERNPTNVQWKEVPGRYSGNEEPALRGGTDYLLAYWFGRYLGVIDPSM